MGRFNDGPRSGGSGGFGGGNRFRSFEPREMSKATCSECGKECEVPFKPTEGKPVYCKECYMKKKPRF
ncbi:MAG: DNA-directed RNA polymerase [Nanoarchaeota archaeon]|nr:DNA-directed RNA polymerase [Nanoarchaeota archaeon]